MLVRRITLQNFKNHRSLDWQDIDGHCNLVLGKNGQGKSNIHIALLFALSDLYGSEETLKKREVLNVELVLLRKAAHRLSQCL